MEFGNRKKYLIMTLSCKEEIDKWVKEQLETEFSFLED